MTSNTAFTAHLSKKSATLLVGKTFPTAPYGKYLALLCPTLRIINYQK